MKNQKGFIHFILCIFIFVIFAFTLYVCLDVLDLIEVPEKYSVSKWLADNSGNTDGNAIVENTYRKIRVEMEDVEDPLASASTAVPPDAESYKSAEQLSSNDEKPDYSYYYQLDSYAKIMYDELEKNLDNMKTGTYNVDFGKTFNDLLHEDNGEETLNNSFQLAINALNFDNPELFYLDISKINLLTRITTKFFTTKYEVEIGAANDQSYLNSSFQNADDVNKAISAINNEKLRIESRASGSTENKIKEVHDYMVDNLEYDSSVSKDNIYNIYGALINKYTVCEGYARAFKSIMDDLDIPCLIACGTGINSNGDSESHAWNYVQIDGSWYAIDVTWDDPVIIGIGYVNKNVKYKYYLKGSQSFFGNHIEKGDIVGDANFSYPKISEYDY